MAADGTSIKNDIDSNLAGKGYRGIRIVHVITALKNVVDWVTSAVNNSGIATWLKSSDNQPGGATTEAVYRTGHVGLGGKPTYLLDLKQPYPTNGVLLCLSNTTSGTVSGEIGAKIEFNKVDVGGWQIGILGNVSTLCIWGWNGVAVVEMLRINANGYMGLGTNIPYEKLHVGGSIQADGYVRTGSGNKAFKITGVKSASGLTLKTNRYLELMLEDGTIVKVAEVN